MDIFPFGNSKPLTLEMNTDLMSISQETLVAKGHVSEVIYKSFLTLLRRIMESLPPSGEALKKNRTFDLSAYIGKYEELAVRLRHEDGLVMKLAEKNYPDVAKVEVSLDHLLDSMNMLLLYPELNARPSFLFSASKICSLFSEDFAGCLFDMPSSWSTPESHSVFEKYDTSVPFLIVDDPKCGFELLNYADTRISLEPDEYKWLILGCNEYGLDLNQIVKMFILHIPLKHPECCYVFDTYQGKMRTCLKRFLAGSFAWLDESSRLDSAQLVRDYDHIICPGISPSETSVGKAPFPLRISNGDTVFYTLPYFRNHFPFGTLVPVYGFYDEFLSIKSMVRSYYRREKSKRVARSVVLRNECTILESYEGKEKSEDFSALSRNEKKDDFDTAALEENEKELNFVLDGTEAKIEEIRDILQDRKSEKRFVPDSVSDLVFTTFFESGKWTGEDAASAVERMRTLGLPQCAMIESFLEKTKSRSRSKKNDCSVVFASRHDPDATQKKVLTPQNAETWVEAKIMLELMDLSDPDIGTLNHLLNCIGNHVSSGKEHYAGYLVYKDERYLWKALSSGYQISISDNAVLHDSKIETLEKLAMYLIPEACFELGKRRCDAYLKKCVNPSWVSLSDKPFFYLKIAAAKKYPPALRHIATIVYKYFVYNMLCAACNRISESRWKILTSIPCDEYLKKYSRIVHTICLELDDEDMLDIRAVSAFCLEYYVKAKKALEHPKTPEAFFCKGWMYWKGEGYVQDLTEALNCMKKAGSFPGAQKVCSAIEQEIKEKNKN